MIAPAPKTAAHRTPECLNGLTEEERNLYSQIPAEIDLVDHESYAHAETENELFGPDALLIDVPQWSHFPDVAEDIVPSRDPRMSLKGKEEVVLFRRYNYSRYRLRELVKAQASRPTLLRAKLMLAWYSRMQDARATLTRANMALVLAMAKRTRIPNVEFAELISEGNMALLRSVEKFDVSRGFKFSTYACRSILKSFNRLATKTGRYRQHFPTEFDPEFERSDHDEVRHETQRTDSVDSIRDILSRNEAHLTDMEKTIVLERFAIISRGKGKTLAEVGKIVGLTNERVRQIQNSALSKIRAALDDAYLVA